MIIEIKWRTMQKLFIIIAGPSILIRLLEVIFYKSNNPSGEPLIALIQLGAIITMVGIIYNVIGIIKTPNNK